MDLDTDVIDSALLLADSVHRYAASKGWPREEYRIYVDVDTRWTHFVLELVTNLADWTREHAQVEAAVEVREFMREDLRADPELFRSFGLIVWPRKGYGYRRPKREGIASIDDALLNPGVRDFRGDLDRHEEALKGLIPR